MSYRQFCLSLLLSFFLLGSMDSLIAMVDAGVDTESVEDSDSSSYCLRSPVINRSFFTEAIACAPDLYGPIYFSILKQWQENLLKSYEGNAFDDKRATFGIMVNSHKLNQ